MMSTGLSMSDIRPSMWKYLSWVVDEIEKGRELTDYSQLIPWHYKAAIGDIEAPSQGKAA